MEDEKKTITLAEIIAAGSIVGILAACVYPVVAGGADKTNAKVCQSNLKQLGLGFNMYANDYDEEFPLGTKWESGTYPYIKSAAVYMCPGNVQKPKGDLYPVGYAFNANIAEKNLSILSSPSVTVMAVDYKTTYAAVKKENSVNLFSITNGITPENIDAWGGISRLGSTPVKPTIHESGIVSLFSDGHVKWLTPQEFSSGDNAPTPQSPASRYTAAGAELSYKTNGAATFSAI